MTLKTFFPHIIIVSQIKWCFLKIYSRFQSLCNTEAVTSRCGCESFNSNAVIMKTCIYFFFCLIKPLHHSNGK